jgi:hypothetical protein
MSVETNKKLVQDFIEKVWNNGEYELIPDFVDKIISPGYWAAKKP